MTPLLDKITIIVYFIVAVFMAGYGIAIFIDTGIERDVFLFIVIGGMCLRVAVDKLLELEQKTNVTTID